MDTNQLKEQVRKDFDKKFCSFSLSADERCDECVHKTFDGSSVADHHGSADEYIKSFIDSIIDRTVKMAEGRIVGIIEKTKLPTNSSKDGATTLAYIPDEYFNQEINKRVDWVISLITNKSDLSGN